MSKGLSIKYLTNFLNVTLSKLRIQEVLESSANTNAFHDHQKSGQSNLNLFSKLNGNFFKFLRTIELDQFFNLYATSTDSEANFD